MPSQVESGLPASLIEPPQKPEMSSSPPRFIIIGAGARGLVYANAIHSASCGIVAAVAEPNAFRRESLGRKYIWGNNPPSPPEARHLDPSSRPPPPAEEAGDDGQQDGGPGPGPGPGLGPREGQSFADWREFVAYETERRARAAAGEPDVPPGVDGAFVALLDAMHRDAVVALAPLGIHIMCEKPLAPSLDACIDMYAALAPLATARVFSVGHVLRYSPHNVLLRRLLVRDRAIGAVGSVVHTEPVGWWHFAHSYVRGHWRRERTSAPSLLTKCCHDVDLLMWLLCYPDGDDNADEKTDGGGGGSDGRGASPPPPPHLPESVSSSGGRHFFRRSRKPPAAGAATNCMTCPLGEAGCKYSAREVYLGPRHQGLATGNTGWPVSVVVGDIEAYPGAPQRAAALARALAEDWDASTPDAAVAARNWFGRCVFEADNDVCDDQVVTMAWAEQGPSRPAKRATLHMVAQTKRQCDRFTHFYGEDGEIYADSHTITVQNFGTGETVTYRPKQEHYGHGGGDVGLARQFVAACDKVKNHGWGAERAQAEFVGCTLEDVLRSHGMVFAAEEARVSERVVKWADWWEEEVTGRLAASSRA